ncbi:MAG TPA: hypothetical protein VJ183_19040 [Chloroflexia bacterium]|nr:hypothetical protein [Chloroflexia bacterium]
MIDHIRREYERFDDLPFPDLGKVVGDFPFYDSLLAGVVHSYITGRLVDFDVDNIPIPDDGTVEVVDELRRKPIRTLEEQEFLDYFDVLQNLQVMLQRALQQEGSTS